MRSKLVPVTTDVLVVGGGIAGCNAARAAAERGARVVVMDKGKIERSGASRNILSETELQGILTEGRKGQGERDAARY
jgi:succinate dehydrogenase/fumarate reductase flavoprotein subunit